MSIKTIFKNAVLVMALMCLTFVTASAQNEVVKTFLFSTATTAQDYLSLSMTDPDDNTKKTVISASGDMMQQLINRLMLMNVTNNSVGSTGSDVEFIISPYVNGKVTKVEFTNAGRSSIQTESCDKHFSMRIDGMKYNGTDEALTGDGSNNEQANFSFISTSNAGIVGNLSMILEAGFFELQKDSKLIITYIPNVAPTHQHNFSFNAVGNTLTATCAHDDGLECSLAETNYQTTLTLTAKSGAYGDYVYHSATHNLSGFNAKTGLNATTNGVVHTNKNDNTTSTSSVNAIGEYTATLVVTIGNNNYTLSTEFSIYNHIVDYTNNDPNLLDCPTYGFSDGDYTATITFHPINGISLRTLTITGANTNLSIGNGITDNGDNTYSFTSPREAVTIDATFGLTIDGSSSEPISIASDIEVDEVTYSRTFTADGGAYTIMLPFSFTVTNAVKGTFHTLSSIAPTTENPSVWKATMSEAITTIEANKPYIFVPSEDFDEMTFENVTLKKTTDAPLTNVCANTNWKLHGVYSKKVWTDEDVNNYGFAAAAKDDISVGEFVHFVTGATLKATRCYLEYNKDGFSKSAVVLPERIILVFPDETASVIEPNDPENNGDVITPVSEIAPNSGVKVWSYGGTIFIEAQPNTDYSVIDITGRTLKTGVTSSTRETVTLSRRAAGIVIVKINGKTFKINY
ncbi:MAG: hypothetical protein PUC50_17810 [Bacteroidales bacterium]|nr:hypothetical protein [Bacteroidales bacterium]